MKRVVIGTAGHIDHGKTTLIKALTGMETDTTKEEQQRGLSINLGFAYLDLPSGERIGLVDVPGHEKFIKNMVAGASGIDMVLLVIDANEGIMAQTKEHIDILTLLGIKNYIIILTKVDDVDPELKELVKLDVEEAFQDTVLENAPIIETDAISGTGIDELVHLIDEMTQSIKAEEVNLPARMNVDRAFSVKGFGTVVTGTLIEGTIEVGDDLHVYPRGLTTKVRSIQIHEEDQPRAFAGNRTALNLTKLSLDEIGRGDVLSANELEPTYMLDVKLKCLASAKQPIELWDRVHLHIGTRDILARVVPLGQERIMPGQEGFAQLRLEERVAVKRDDNFIIRYFSPVITIGGGIVLDAHPDKHKRFNEEVIESLAIKEEGDLSDIILDFLERRTFATMTSSEVADYLNEDAGLVSQEMESMTQEGKMIAYGNRYISARSQHALLENMAELLENYHQEYPLRPGMSLEEFRSNYNKLSARDLSAVMREFTESGQGQVHGDLIKSANFNVALNPEQEKIKSKLVNTLLEAGLTPPTYEELTGGDKKTIEMLNSLLNKEVFQLDRITYLHMGVYNEAIEKVKAHIEANGQITLAEFRDLMDTSRKYALLFLDHLDNIGLTKRVEDYRVFA